MFRTVACSKCGTEIGFNRIKTHERVCDGSGPYRLIKTVRFETDSEGNKICPDCQKSFSPVGAQTHWRLVHRGDVIVSSKTGLPPRGGWNKGLTKESNESIARASEKLSVTLKRKMKEIGPDERKRIYGGPRKFSPLSGGIRKGAGRGKSGWYDGFWCDSSWELAWVIHALDHSVKFSRNMLSYEYEFEGKISKFYPDFLLESGELIEVKGYFDRRNIAKIEAVSGLKVLGKEEIKPYLDYATQKFGTDFVSVAYQKPPEFTCCDCGARVTKHAPRCARCAGLKNAKYKIEWPSDEDLISMVGDSNMNQVAKNLGVSFTAVKKRLKAMRTSSSNVERHVEAVRDAGSSPV